MRAFITLSMVFAMVLACKDAPKDAAVLAASAEPISDSTPIKHRRLSPDFSDYWYNGLAEINAFKLSQARYGEIHEGQAVLIYVTEPFLPEEQVKADRSGDHTTTVLKLNSTKKFLTGIYPYSLMSSVFTPISTKEHAIKTTFSSQEWCGQTYVQLNNRDSFDINSHSYFERNNDTSLHLDKVQLENDVWTHIRLNPEGLPTGSFKMLPSLEYLGLNHKTIKAYDAEARIENDGARSIYVLKYPNLEREVRISYTTAFPHSILEWEEITVSGGQQLITKAERLEQIRSDYWNRNKVKDVGLRKKLGL